MRNHRLLKFFSYEHLPENLRDVSRPYCDLAFKLDQLLPESAEKTVSLRKLLESKDAGVRAYLDRDD